MNAAVLEEGVTCWALAGVERASVLVDAEAYYASFCAAALAARRYIYITGWQFDTQARLLRPEPERPPEHPIELVPFLSYLCERNVDLSIYITAWDYSVLYALEREWLQKLRFAFQSHERVHFEFLAHPEAGGCHHQKLAIVDGEIAFIGGLDLCDSRWDTRRHLKADPRRIDVHGKPYKPFHDIQVALRGPVVEPLEQVFLEGWRRVRGKDPELSPPASVASPGAAAPEALERDQGLPLRARRAAVCRTEWGDSEQPGACEIQALLERAILGAERLIYIETQYFTSRALAEALFRRLSDPARSKLGLVLVMPAGADSPKEDFVLGNRQRAIRRFVADAARHYGHQFRLLMSTESTDAEPCPATFVHSKLLIVDDELITIGSANFTNRSMRVDHEVNVAWETRLEAPADAAQLSEDIRRLRASLLSEHAGVEEGAFLCELAEVIERVDEACERPGSKLRCQELPAPDGDDPLLIAIFDPSGPLDWDTIDDSLEQVFQSDEGVIQRGAQKIGQRLGVVDID